MIELPPSHYDLWLTKNLAGHGLIYYYNDRVYIKRNKDNVEPDMLVIGYSAKFSNLYKSNILWLEE